MEGELSIGIVTIDIGNNSVNKINESKLYLKQIKKNLLMFLIYLTGIETKIFKAAHPVRLVNQQIQSTCHPSKSSNDSENSSDHQTRCSYDNKIAASSDKNLSSRNNDSNDIDDHHRDTEMIDVEMKRNKVESKIYHVLIFIESLRNVKEHGREYFLTYEVISHHLFYSIMVFIQALCLFRDFGINVKKQQISLKTMYLITLSNLRLCAIMIFLNEFKIIT